MLVERELVVVEVLVDMYLPQDKLLHLDHGQLLLVLVDLKMIIIQTTQLHQVILDPIQLHLSQEEQ